MEILQHKGKEHQFAKKNAVWKFCSMKIQCKEWIDKSCESSNAK
jgi:hypothetical protein